MARIPLPALALGLSGLIPFLYGAATLIAPSMAFLPLSGVQMLNVYGLVILSFMAGVLWGFAARAEPDFTLYAASVAPALLAFIPAMFAPSLYGGRDGTTLLLVAFLFLFALDWWFSNRGLTPDWWMGLRAILTAVVAICLAIGAFA